MKGREITTAFSGLRQSISGNSCHTCAVSVQSEETTSAGVEEPHTTSYSTVHRIIGVGTLRSSRTGHQASPSGRATTRTTTSHHTHTTSGHTHAGEAR